MTHPRSGGPSSPADPSIPAALSSVPLRDIIRIDVALEGRWSETVVPVWTRDAGFLGFDRVVWSDAALRPALELYFDGWWIGIRCHRTHDTGFSFDVPRARSIIGYVERRIALEADSSSRRGSSGAGLASHRDDQPRRLIPRLTSDGGAIMAAKKASSKSATKRRSSGASRSSARKSGGRKSSAKKSSAKKSGRRYGEGASRSVESAMRRRKKGTLTRGKSGHGGKVKSRKQAIAIGLSEARKKGAKVPRKRSASGGRKRSSSGGRKRSSSRSR